MTSNDKQTDSNLVTIGAEIQATDKLQFSVKREQNLGDADPTYPTQTTLGATYQVNALTQIVLYPKTGRGPDCSDCRFHRQRLCRHSITPGNSDWR